MIKIIVKNKRWKLERDNRRDFVLFFNILMGSRAKKGLVILCYS